MFKIKSARIFSLAIASLLGSMSPVMSEEAEDGIETLHPVEQAMNYSFVRLATPDADIKKNVEKLKGLIAERQIKDSVAFDNVGLVLIPNAERPKLEGAADLIFEPDSVVYGFASDCNVESAPEYSSALGINDMWGLKRVWGSMPPNFYDDSKNEGKAAWIIDSGLADGFEPDELAVASRKNCRYRLGKPECLNEAANPKKRKDSTSHGTMIAGIIGAKNNNEGITGVAPGVSINSLRVFRSNAPQTNLSRVAAALDWLNQPNFVKIDKDPATPSPGDVVNLSLGTGWNPALDSAPALIEKAIRELADKGLKVSIAAGNIDTMRGVGMVQAISPARAGDYEATNGGGVVMTASGMGKTADATKPDPFWEFSAFGNSSDKRDSSDNAVPPAGPPDFAEPAKDIISLWPGKELAVCSGTSFAAAYLSGLLLWGPPKPGGPSTGDPSAIVPDEDITKPISYDSTLVDQVGIH